MDTVQLIQKENYAILKMERGKVNAINQQLVNDLRSALKEVEGSQDILGLILTGKENFFSAGLDLVELYDYDKEQTKTFFETFVRLQMELIKFKKPLIAAISGHAPAGGTVLALPADYKIMVDGEKYQIGLNEMKLNLPIPQIIANSYAFWLGKAKANEFLLDGKLFNPKEALACGLINEVVVADKLLAHAELKMKAYVSADSAIFQAIKYSIRNSLIKELPQQEAFDQEQKKSSEMWWSPKMRTDMGNYVNWLKTKNTRSLS